MKRMNTTWYRLRWIILNRDRFTCQYCGRKAPDVILQVDHKISKVNGGSDNEENLITSCIACNIGKNSESLGIPVTNMRPVFQRVNLTQRMLDYLRTQPGGATGTEIAISLGANRANVAKILSQCPELTRTRVKNSVLYSLKVM